MSFTVVIPARFESGRLPGKPLIEIAGKPMIEWVWRRALASQASQVIIATDDVRILRVCQKFGAKSCLTDVSHMSGTDRIAEAADILGLEDDELVVNLQGDEPLMPANVINQVANNLEFNVAAELSTLCTPILSDSEFRDPNVVKVLRDSDGFAVIFSRAPVPYNANDAELSVSTELKFRHLGLYAYRVGFLKRFSEWESVPLEQYEKLEQLRAIHYRVKIYVEIACEKVPAGVDTEEDLIAVRESFTQVLGA